MTPRLADLAPLVPGGVTPEAAVPLHGDGSVRRYYRVAAGGRPYVLLVGPDPEENAAWVRVARHLAERGLRVPAVYGVDPARGWVLLEDLGDRSLYAALREPGADSLALYRPVVALLAAMQVRGAEGFHLGVGFAPAPYDRELMTEGEAGYFAREFAAGLLGLAVPPGFARDAEALAAEVGRAPGDYFLHRDFQSRNVHLTPDGPALLDFQGARPGPLGYDAAALLLDPYAALPQATRGELLGYYRTHLAALGADLAHFDEAWHALGTFRLLQALGAFAKLGGRLGKPGFLEHAGTALAHLAAHLGERGHRETPALTGLVERCREAWEQRSNRPGREAPLQRHTGERDE